MKLGRFIFPILALLILTQCISYDLSRRIVQQGNLLPSSKIARLKLGMSKQDVVQLMGSSLTHNIFDTNHLDYAYTWRQGDKTTHLKYLCLIFQNNRLIHIDHNVISHS